MVVVIILAVAAAAVMPNAAKSIKATELRSSAQNFASMVRLGQIRAMTQGRWARVVMNKKDYWLEQDSAKEDQLLDGSGKPMYVRLTGRYGRTQKLPGEIELKGYPGEIVFSPEGRITPGELQVCRREECLTVAMGRELGRIEIIEADKDETRAL